MLKLTEFDKIIRTVAKDFGYQTKPRLAWKRGPELTTIVQLKKYSWGGFLPMIGVLPTVFITKPTPPRAEGSLLLLCHPDRFPKFEFNNVFVATLSLDDKGSREITPEIARVATVAMFEWIEQHMANEANLRAELLSSDKQRREAYSTNPCIMSWAKGTFRLDDWEPHLWPRYGC